MTTMQKNRLWNKNFTIITLGTVVSTLGMALSSFAISLMVLDLTKSTFLYALYMVAHNFPKMFAPIIAGPFLDRFSRRRVIYTLDFFSATLYLGLYFLLTSGLSSGPVFYPIFLAVTFIMGSVDGVYSVAYESLYPNLVTEGNLSKAYSVSSMIFPLATFMMPVASLIYGTLGSIAPLMLLNSATYLVAAIFETQIRCDEKHVDRGGGATSLKRYTDDFRLGLNYIKNEKGLLRITAYFGINMFTGSALGVLMLPFFQENAENIDFTRYIDLLDSAVSKLGIFGSVVITVSTLYSIYAVVGVLGRLIGGFIHYKVKYPLKARFAIALGVYALYTIIDGSMLFMPYPIMMLFAFISGVSGVTSFTIRTAATHSYVPDSYRARFAGTFSMIMTCGTLLGQLIVGLLGEVFDPKMIVLTFNIINMFAVYFVVYRGREDIKKIYNREVD